MVQKVAETFKAGLRHPTTGKLCQPNSKWVHFSNQGRIMQRKARDRLCLSFAVPNGQWDSHSLPLWLYDYEKPLPFTFNLLKIFLVAIALLKLYY